MTRRPIFQVPGIFLALCVLTHCGGLNINSGPQGFSVVYDFEKSVGSEWSNPHTFDIGGNKVLGLFNDENKKYRPGTRLKLTNIPKGSEVVLDFDLYLIGTWDSSGELSDRWTLNVSGGDTLIDMTRFPNAYRDKEEKIPVGNDGSVTVGVRPRDYWIVHQHVAITPGKIRGNSLVLVFSGDLTGRKTEFWALDDVKVVVRKPSSRP